MVEIIPRARVRNGFWTGIHCKSLLNQSISLENVCRKAESAYTCTPPGADPLAGLPQEVYMYMRILPFGIRFQGKLTDLVVICNESLSKTRYARARAE